MTLNRLPNLSGLYGVGRTDLPTDHFKCSVVKKWIKTKQKLEEPGYSTKRNSEEETFDLGPRDE